MEPSRPQSPTARRRRRRRPRTLWRGALLLLGRWAVAGGACIVVHTGPLVRASILVRPWLTSLLPPLPHARRTTTFLAYSGRRSADLQAFTQRSLDRLAAVTESGGAAAGEVSDGEFHDAGTVVGTALLLECMHSAGRVLLLWLPLPPCTHSLRLLASLPLVAPPPHLQPRGAPAWTPGSRARRCRSAPRRWRRCGRRWTSSGRERCRRTSAGRCR